MTMKLRDICLAIKAGYAAEKSMYDAGMIGLVEDLTGRVDEILSLIDPCTAADDAAPQLPSGNSAIPHADLIRAALYGKTVQWDSDGNGRWQTYTTPQEAIRSMLIYLNHKYRLKPEPAVRWLPVWAGGHVGDDFDSKEQLATEAWKYEYQPGYKVLRLELDPDTLEVISAKTEAP